MKTEFKLDNNMKYRINILKLIKVLREYN